MVSPPVRGVPKPCLECSSEVWDPDHITGPPGLLGSPRTDFWHVNHRIDEVPERGDVEVSFGDDRIPDWIEADAMLGMVWVCGPSPKSIGVLKGLPVSIRFKDAEARRRHRAKFGNLGLVNPTPLDTDLTYALRLHVDGLVDVFLNGEPVRDPWYQASARGSWLAWGYGQHDTPAGGSRHYKMTPMTHGQVRIRFRDDATRLAYAERFGTINLA